MKSTKIELDGKKIDLKIIEGSENEKAIDITNLRKESGYVTYDPGLVNTGSCLSDITFIDGKEGILRYRGYPIEELAEKASFLDVCYLLIYGELPSQEKSLEFANNVKHHTMIHEDFKKLFDGYPINAHPMGVLCSTAATLSTFYPSSENQDLDLNVLRLIAKMQTLATFSYKKSIGQPFIYPRNDLKYEENFYHMMFATPSDLYSPNSTLVDALRLLLILHADHEQNCSTSTVRIVGSSGANLYISIAAGIAALSGKLHGGANQKVIEMLKMIQDDGNDFTKYINLAKNKDSNFRLYGFGHRVYKSFDPRAKILKKAADKVLNELKISDPLLDIAKELEEVALTDKYFLDRNLYPNVDFYSGIIYQAIGIPTSMFTVMFALGRLPGWIAQWKELSEDKSQKISRPRQIFTGKTKRNLK
tara:strand:- start:1431 stop:2687 length:1257 start_codon:yes stop_codon:yes gene_type:complete